MRTNQSVNKKEAGYTVIEFLVTSAILAILAAIAIPNFVTFRQNARLNTATRELFTGFQQAKMTAIKNNRTCAISFNTTISGETYDYVVYIDQNGDLRYDTGETIIATKKFETGDQVSLVSINFADNDDGVPTIAFGPFGTPKDKNNNLVNGDISLSNPYRTQKIQLTLAGNVKITS